MRRVLLILCALVTGCSATFTGLAIEGVSGTDPNVTATTDLGGERVSVEAPRQNLACLGLICDPMRVPGEGACNDSTMNPFAGTRIAEFFTCYGASGACMDDSNRTLNFANGARLSTVSSEVSLTGPGASEPCILGGEHYSNGSATSALVYFQL